MFADRTDAGRQLAARLVHMPDEDLVVLGLPRGGVPVAFEVASALGAPLDVIIVRKLGAPGQPELAMGAIGEDGVRILNQEVMRAARVTTADLRRIEAAERAELARRARELRGHEQRMSLERRTALIVDDGIATGSTARAACTVARAHGAARVIVAAPIASPQSVAELRDVADEVVVLSAPESFRAVGQFYDDFSQTSDDEVVRLLRRAHTTFGANGVGIAGGRSRVDEEVAVDAGRVRLPGHLVVPDDARGVVVFAHGSASSRHSTRNQLVADVLDRAGLGTLLFDLLTPEEARDRDNVFDVALLAARLVDATHSLRDMPIATGTAVGYFGASTGAAAALWASTDPAVQVDAVVSRGGRPDLAGPRLAAVRAPTLLIVGGEDTAVLELNRGARAQMHCETALRIVPGATHLFAEPGALATAAELARAWFLGHLAPLPQSAQ
jgi:putative phosphoribosyl transferase